LHFKPGLCGVVVLHSLTAISLAQEFAAAMVKRYLSINTNTKDKILKPADLRNELLIITASEEVYQLWAKFIVDYGTGELIDPDTEVKFNQAKDWESFSRKLTLNREFFKAMGQLDERDLKILALHLLNQTPGRTLKYPKVTVKKPTKNYFHCMAAKQWVENRKRKNTVARELHNLRPSLGLFDSEWKFDADKWKQFKKDYNLSRQTMAMLLSVPGDSFFTAYRQKKSKNKSVEQISEYAAEFFKKFLDVKGDFESHTPILHTRLFDSSEFKFGAWDGNYAWGDSRCSIGIIDLRCVPGSGSKSDDTENPYFKEFLDTYMATVSDPSLKSPHVWVWITENVDRQCQALVYANKIKDEYVHKVSNYMPCRNERLNGIPEGKVMEKHMVPLLFLVKKGSNTSDILGRIPPTFYAPELPLYTKAGMYREHDFGVRMTELRLEFYCRVLKLFSVPGEKFLSLMAGSKPMLAGFVRFAAPFFAIYFLARVELNLHTTVDLSSCCVYVL
jgi:hypothetical protein